MGNTPSGFDDGEDYDIPSAARTRAAPYISNNPPAVMKTATGVAHDDIEGSLVLIPSPNSSNLPNPQPVVVVTGPTSTTSGPVPNAASKQRLCVCKALADVRRAAAHAGRHTTTATPSTKLGETTSTTTSATAAAAAPHHLSHPMNEWLDGESLMLTRHSSGKTATTTLIVPAFSSPVPPSSHTAAATLTDINVISSGDPLVNNPTVVISEKPHIQHGIMTPPPPRAFESPPQNEPNIRVEQFISHDINDLLTSSDDDDDDDDGDDDGNIDNGGINVGDTANINIMISQHSHTHDELPLNDYNEMTIVLEPGTNLDTLLASSSSSSSSSSVLSSTDDETVVPIASIKTNHVTVRDFIEANKLQQQQLQQEQQQQQQQQQQVRSERIQIDVIRNAPSSPAYSSPAVGFSTEPELTKAAAAVPATATSTPSQQISEEMASGFSLDAEAAAAPTVVQTTALHAANHLLVTPPTHSSVNIGLAHTAPQYVLGDNTHKTTNSITTQSGVSSPRVSSLVPQIVFEDDGENGHSDHGSDDTDVHQQQKQKQQQHININNNNSNQMNLPAIPSESMIDSSVTSTTTITPTIVTPAVVTILATPPQSISLHQQSQPHVDTTTLPIRYCHNCGGIVLPEGYNELTSSHFTLHPDVSAALASATAATSLSGNGTVPAATAAATAASHFHHSLASWHHITIPPKARAPSNSNGGILSPGPILPHISGSNNHNNNNNNNNSNDHSQTQQQQQQQLLLGDMTGIALLTTGGSAVNSMVLAQRDFSESLKQVQSEDQPLVMLSRMTNFDMSTIRALKTVFQKIGDHDGKDNLISAHELCVATGIPPDSILGKALFKVMDLTRSNNINFRTWVLMLSKLSPSASLEDKIIFAFNMYDDNGDGFIDRSDLAAMLRSVIPDLGEQDAIILIETAFAQADKDGDRRIDLNDYRNFVVNSSAFHDSFTIDIPTLLRSYNVISQDEIAHRVHKLHERDLRQDERATRQTKREIEFMQREEKVQVVDDLDALDLE